MGRRTALLVVFLVLAGATPALAGFDAMARKLSRLDRLERTGIPFFGLGRFIIRIAHPHGVTDLKLAVFEQKDLSRSIDYRRYLAGDVGGEWNPVVVAHSHGEETFIYARPSGKDRIRMLILAQDDDEVTLLEIEMLPERFLEAMNEPSAVMAGSR